MKIFKTKEEIKKYLGNLLKLVPGIRIIEVIDFDGIIKYTAKYNGLYLCDYGFKKL